MKNKYYYIFFLIFFATLLIIMYWASSHKLEIHPHWIKLSEHNGQLVIVNPSYVQNQEIRINKWQQKLTICWEHEEETFKIVSYKKIDNTSFIIRIRYGAENKEANIQFDYINGLNNVAKWRFSLIHQGQATNHEFIMVESISADNFTTINQQENDTLLTPIN